MEKYISKFLFCFSIKIYILLDMLVGLISVTIINLTALFGAIILPFRNKSAFKWILCTFIGLG